MATLLQVREKANAKLATFWSALQTRQNAYFAKHGKYFQLLAGSNLTLDGVDTPFAVVSPSDEKYTIDIDTSWSDSVPFNIEIHEWLGPNGMGYKGIVTINHEGVLYRRERDSDGADTNWYPMPLIANI